MNNFYQTVITMERPVRINLALKLINICIDYLLLESADRVSSQWDKSIYEQLICLNKNIFMDKITLIGEKIMVSLLLK